MQINLTAKQLAGAAKARLAYNAANPDVMDAEGAVTEKKTLDTDADYVNMVISNAADSWALQHKVGILTSGEFVMRFTSAEFAVILGAADVSPDVAGYVNEVKSRDFVYLDSPLTTEGINALVAGGLLTQVRADEILAL